MSHKKTLPPRQRTEKTPHTPSHTVTHTSCGRWRSAGSPCTSSWRTAVPPSSLSLSSGPESVLLKHIWQIKSKQGNTSAQITSTCRPVQTKSLKLTSYCNSYYTWRSSRGSIYDQSSTVFFFTCKCNQEQGNEMRKQHIFQQEKRKNIIRILDIWDQLILVWEMWNFAYMASPNSLGPIINNNTT